MLTLRSCDITMAAASPAAGGPLTTPASSLEAAGLDEAPLLQSVGPAGRRTGSETGAPDTPVRLCGRGSAGEAERLRGAWSETGDDELVSPTVRGKALDAETISKLVRDRASRRCRTASALVPRQAAERTDPPREVVEAALAHVIDNRI